MRSYHKLSIILKITKYLLLLGIIIHCLYLSTNTIFCLFDKLSCCDNEFTILDTINIKKIVFNTYIITFIIMMFLVAYYGKEKKLSIEKFIIIIGMGILFLPISALLNYNFMILGSLMSSFYLYVATIVMVLSIDFIRGRINKLYKLAVEGRNEVVNEVDKRKKERIKNARKSEYER